MKDSKAQFLSDLLVGIVPIGTFGFPIFFFLLWSLNIWDYETQIVPLLVGPLFLLYAFYTIITWRWNLKIKPRQESIPSNQSIVLRALGLSAIDDIFLFLNLILFYILEKQTGTPQLLWGIWLTLISAPIVKFMLDLHKSIEIYDKIIKFIHDKI